jgi:hypothetical protein
MLEEKDSNIRQMKRNKTIYIQLLGEGTKVHRPVIASEIGENIYKVGEYKTHDHDEVWEFIPGTIVVVEEQLLDGENVLVAIKEQKEK